MYYVYDIGGLEEPIGPLGLEEAQSLQKQLGKGWGILTQEEAESIYTYLTEE